MKYSRHTTRVLGGLFASLVLAAVPTKAHHSAAAYDTNETATVSGVVQRLQWRIPHIIIRLEVEDEDGNQTIWPLEAAGIQAMVNDGWSKELVGPGRQLTAEIRPTKGGAPGGVLRWVTLADGRVLPIDPESPTGAMVADGDGASASSPVQASLMQRAERSNSDYLARRAVAAREWDRYRPEQLPKKAETGKKGALDAENLAAHEGVAHYDFTGIWSHRSSRELSQSKGGMPWEFLPVPELTQKAEAIRTDILARREAGDATADPATLCYPHGLMRSMTRTGNMMLLQQNTAVYMVHRMNNDYRAIYWDGRDHVDAAVRVDSYNGDSIGYWADDHLYVETIGFGQPHHYINPGIPIGAEGKVEERWRLINDGNTLEIEFRMTDPEHWVGEWIDTKVWDRIDGADIAEANCIVAEDADLAIGAK
jgi:hypothetical protein